MAKFGGRGATPFGSSPWLKAHKEKMRAEAIDSGNFNDGITRTEGGPIGGTVNPAQTYSGHTGFNEEASGKRTGTGGGYAMPIPEQSPAEQMLARPDLVDPNYAAHRANQSGSAVDVPITSIANQMSNNRAQALRQWDSNLSQAGRNRYANAEMRGE